jgi:hypothetical protein
MLPVTVLATAIIDSIGLVDWKVRSRLGLSPQPRHGQRFLEAFTETGGGAGMIGLELLRVLPAAPVRHTQDRLLARPCLTCDR